MEVKSLFSKSLFLVHFFISVLVDEYGLKIITPLIGTYFANLTLQSFWRTVNASLVLVLMTQKERLCIHTLSLVLGILMIVLGLFRVELFKYIKTGITKFSSVGFEDDLNKDPIFCAYCFCILLVCPIVVLSTFLMLHSTVAQYKSKQPFHFLVILLYLGWPYVDQMLIKKNKSLLGLLGFDSIRIWNLLYVFGVICVGANVATLFSKKKQSLIGLITLIAICYTGYYFYIPPPNQIGNFKIIDLIESNTGTVSVIETEIHNARVRLCKVDHSHIGGEFCDYKQSTFSIFHTHEALRLAHASPKSFLAIGLGIGVVVGSMQKHGLTVDVVEIDPVVVHLAEKHFSFYNRKYKPGKLFIEDALQWAKKNNNKYDLLIHDVYTGGSVPPFLFTKEFFTDLKGHLNKKGIFGVNYFGYIRGEKSLDMKMLVNTMRSVFKSVRCFHDEHLDLNAKPAPSNYVCFAAHDHDIKFRDPVEADFLDNSLIERVLKSMPTREMELPSKFDVDFIITDENSEELWKAQQYTCAGHYELMNELWSLEDYWYPLA